MASSSTTAVASAGHPDAVQPSDSSQESHHAVERAHQHLAPADAALPEDSAQETAKERFWSKFEEGQKSDWWFASTGIPLLAATLGPLANLSSIAALVSSWRAQVIIDGQYVGDIGGAPFHDPRWCYWLNVGSLICGFLGNLFLLFNFTQRIRYIVALPATIIFWYLACGILIGITACMEIYAPPHRPEQTYTQGFWYAIAAASLYFLCSMLLMVNMLGYFIGHYSDDFALSDSQRTLILQTMLFFIWLGGGAAVFSRIEKLAGQEDSWQYADSMYYCVVTVLTVGFGDLYPTSDLGRGLVFPYSVGGIVTLALIVSSIYRFMRDLGEENIVQKHTEHMRQRTSQRIVTNSFDLRQREHGDHHGLHRRHALPAAERPTISSPSGPRIMRNPVGDGIRKVVSRTATISLPPARKLRDRRPRLLLLREEKDRFDTMRRIQEKSADFRKWIALVISVTAFGILWCVGAVVFWQAEKKAQNLTYFQSLYFCYVSLLTIGYGDLSPKSNAGRTFFVIWSLIAVPTMTILVSDMGDTVVHKFKKLSDQLADFTVLPKDGIWATILEKHPGIKQWIQNQLAKRAANERLKRGFATADPYDTPNDDPTNDADPELQLDRQATMAPSLPLIAREMEDDVEGKVPSRASLSRRLAMSIKRVAGDLRLAEPKRYDYEDWVEFSRLIRHCNNTATGRLEDIEGEEEGRMLDWDWMGANSPLISGLAEADWLLNNLCQSLVKLERRKEVILRSAGHEPDDLLRLKRSDTMQLDAQQERPLASSPVAEGAESE